MRDPANPKRPQVLLPMKYLAEVRNAPQSQLSFPLVSTHVCKPYPSLIELAPTE